jgi:hypothetical protein
MWALWRGIRNPKKGEGGSSPINQLRKFRKYKGGRKCHTMVALSSPKMFR